MRFYAPILAYYHKADFDIKIEEDEAPVYLFPSFKQGGLSILCQGGLKIGYRFHQ